MTTDSTFAARKDYRVADLSLIASRSARAPSSARNATSSSSSAPRPTRGCRGSSVQRFVEMLGRQRGELGEQRGLRTTAASRSRSRWTPASRTRGVAACVPLRAAGRPAARAGPARERLARQIEPVGEQAKRLLALG